ncbi:hypothetical protein ACFQE0_13780 [Methylobacterium komagatae]|uniref:DUF4355 domain-containing protein n=1 Tax=Methylobacterium komagatae TaxID=374425 RepID=A0ABW2BL59_9HYPH
MDEDLIVLGAQAETPAAGAEGSPAAGADEGHEAQIETAATPGEEQAESAAQPKPEPKTGEGDEGEPEKPKKRTGIHRMQDQIARLKAELESVRSASTGAGEDRKAAIEKEIGPAPKEADFDDYAAFEDAKAEHRLKKVLAEQRHADRAASDANRQAAARDEAVEAFQDRLEDVREAIPDADAVLKAASDREVKPHVQELVVESEKGGLLAYYLAKNPEKLAELNRMTPLQAAKAVGALEPRLTLAKPKKTPSAPAPAKPVGGSAAPSSPDAELDAWLAKTYRSRGA